MFLLKRQCVPVGLKLILFCVVPFTKKVKIQADQTSLMGLSLLIDFFDFKNTNGTKLTVGETQLK